VNSDERLKKAARALASAKLLKADGDFDGACNRAYYAMFDAAHAALMGSGVHLNPATTKTHRGLIAAFGQHLVKPGWLPHELGKRLNQVERMRLIADYTGEAIEEEKVLWAIEQAELFLETVRQKFSANPS
jgi:uncharacterized protein (UPF0332 family)